MKDIASTTKGDTARGDVVVERAVAWHHVGDVTAAGGHPAWAVRHRPHRCTWTVTVVSRPSRTLGHLLGRRARSDLGANEEGITIDSVRRRMGEELPGLIGNSGGEANIREHSESRVGSN
jgi:hypothetical protein